MPGMKRSTIAPVGMALLFLSFATVPFSLSGSEPSLSSRLDSLAKAWSQVAGVFLTVYQPSNAAQLLALEYSNSDPDPVTDPDPADEPVIALNSGAVPDALDDLSWADSQPDLTWSGDETIMNQEQSRCANVPARVPAKRSRVTSPRRVAPASPINVRRIDMGEVMMKLALQGEDLKRFIHLNLADHKIETKFELSKLTKFGMLPARPTILVKPGTSGCDEASEPVPGAGPAFRERSKRNRLPVPAGVGVQS
jgi:hypothetical protein